jgi:putative addiction module CopG family antidote
MNVSLGDVLDAYVRSQVDSGQYGNASEMIREALRLKT